MSLKTVSLTRNIRTQYSYRLRAYSDLFNKLIIFQAVGLLLAFGGEGAAGYGSDFLNVNLTYYSSDLIISATMFWAFIMGAVLPQKQSRVGDFYFVANRFSLNVANMMLLGTAAVAGGITAILANYVMKCILKIGMNKTWSFDATTEIGGALWLQGAAAIILYVLLFAAIGYWLGALVSVNRLIAYIIGGIAIAVLVLLGMTGKFGLFEWMDNFYFQEASFPIFFIKVVVTVVILLGMSLAGMNQREVRL